MEVGPLKVNCTDIQEKGGTTEVSITIEDTDNVCHVLFISICKCSFLLVMHD